MRLSQTSSIVSCFLNHGTIELSTGVIDIMNSCILMAEVITNPELRKTPDDVDVANMMVEFPGLREEDPTTRIRVVGWRNLGVEMSQNYSTGDRVVIEGRLSMNVVEMNGYKEKRAELVASHIYSLGESSNSNLSQPMATASNVVDFQSSTSEPVSASTPGYSSTPAAVTSTAEEYDEGTLDEIPF